MLRGEITGEGRNSINLVQTEKMKAAPCCAPDDGSRQISKKAQQGESQRNQR